MCPHWVCCHAFCITNIFLESNLIFFCTEIKLLWGYRFYDVLSPGQVKWANSRSLLPAWRKTADSRRLICLSESHSTKQMLWQHKLLQLLRVINEGLNHSDTGCIPFGFLYICIMASGIPVIILIQPVIQLLNFFLGIVSCTLKEWSQSLGFKRENQIQLICHPL